MQKKTIATTTMLLLAAGCAVQTPEAAITESALYPIPDAVVAIAGPDQDLTTARLDPSDGCYWYYHAGPVETTLVPLRAANGNQICNAAPA